MERTGLSEIDGKGNMDQISQQEGTFRKERKYTEDREGIPSRIPDRQEGEEEEMRLPISPRTAIILLVAVVVFTTWKARKAKSGGDIDG